MALELPAILETELRTLTEAQLNLRLPLHALMGEAVDVARFAQRYWAAEREPGSTRILRPGLELTGRSLNPEIIPHILLLQDATQEAQTAYLLALTPARGNDTMIRARFVLGEITAALEWLFDDGIEDERDVQLRNLTDAHRDAPDSQDALASELDDFASLAEQKPRTARDARSFRAVPHRGRSRSCQNPARTLRDRGYARRSALAARPSYSPRGPTADENEHSARGRPLRLFGIIRRSFARSRAPTNDADELKPAGVPQPTGRRNPTGRGANFDLKPSFGCRYSFNCCRVHRDSVERCMADAPVSAP